MSLQRPFIRYGTQVVLGMLLLLLLASPILASPLQQNCATMGFSPTSVWVSQVGDIVTLQVLLDADGVTFNAAGFEISFDQTLLQVVDAAGDPASRDQLRLDASSRIVTIGTEGATDPTVYRRIVGRRPGDVASEDTW